MGNGKCCIGSESEFLQSIGGIGAVYAERIWGMEREMRRRFFSPVMVALLVVLALAGCTLTLLALQFHSNAKRQELQQAQDAAIASQLEEIQLYLTSVDASLEAGQMDDARGYEALSEEVGAMQQNLTDYRENNVIADDAIGENLDDVIAQLSGIQKNLEEEKRTSESLQEETRSNSSAAEAAREENKQSVELLQQTVNTQLTDVREDIRRLIQEASAGNKAEYKELLAVLNGTDSDLASLEKTVTASNEKLQAAINSGVSSINNGISSGLNTVNGSVSSLRETLVSLQEISAALKQQQEQLQAQQTAILEGEKSLEQQHSTLSENQKSLEEDQKSMLNEQKSLQTTMVAERQNMMSVLEARNSTLEANLSEALENLQKNLVAELDGQSENLQKSLEEDLDGRSENLQKNLTQSLARTLQEENGEDLEEILMDLNTLQEILCNEDCGLGQLQEILKEQRELLNDQGDVLREQGTLLTQQNELLQKLSGDQGNTDSVNPEGTEESKGSGIQ